VEPYFKATLLTQKLCHCGHFLACNHYVIFFSEKREAFALLLLQLLELLEKVAS